MQKAAEEYGVGHIASGECKSKVTMESGILPEEMTPQRKMMIKNEYNKVYKLYFCGPYKRNRKAH